MNAENNVETIRKMYADYARGDMAALFDAMADDIQWITPGNSVLAGERRGREEVAAFFRTIDERLIKLVFEPRDFIPSGDRVIVFGRYEFRSRATGRTAASHWVMVWTLRNGKAAHFQEYTDTSTLEGAASIGSGQGRASQRWGGQLRRYGLPTAALA
jgi:ketosteroid isomerase-like protein